MTGFRVWATGTVPLVLRSPDCWSLRAAGAAHCGPQNFLGVDYYSNSPSLSDRLTLSHFSRFFSMDQ